MQHSAVLFHCTAMDKIMQTPDITEIKIVCVGCIE